MLQQHAMLRKAHQNSNDPDESFLVSESVENATDAATTEKRLSSEEAKKEQSILLYFSNRLALLRDTATLQVNAFYKNMAAHEKEMATFIRKLRNFTETQGKVIVPVFLVVNPEDGSGGGEANGGRLVIELQKHPDPLSFLIHESLHFLIQ